MSEAVGFELNPQPDTSLSQMIEHGLSKHLDRSHLFLLLLAFRHPFTLSFQS